MTENLNELIEHTILRGDATRDDVAKLCAEAREHKFHGVCVNPYWIPDAKRLLDGSRVRIVTVAGFPLGATLSRAKAAEAKAAVEAGADEVDMVINLGAAREGHWDFVEHEIHEVVSAAQGKPVKVIIESAALSSVQIVEVSKRIVAARAHFVKTSTGFGPGGASVEAVRLIRETVGCCFGIKASGGINDRAFAEALIEAGATRIGTSSGPVLVRA
jgi:deoxyribose-phosphate aldolase